MTTIAQERNELESVGGPRLRRREQWGARFNYNSVRPVTEPARTIHVHISVTNPGNYASDDAHARALEAIGISRFPATGISYNRGVMPSAAAYEFQPIGRRGAHTVNDFRRSTCTTPGCPGRGGSLEAPSWNLNVTGRAYVLCQNVQHPVNRAIVTAMADVIAADMLAGFIARGARIHGHRCCSSKSCPGDRMWEWMGVLWQLVADRVNAGFRPTPPTPPPTPPSEEDEMTPDQDKLLRAAANAAQQNRTKMERIEPKVNETRLIVDQTRTKVTRQEAKTDALIAYLSAQPGGATLKAAVTAAVKDIPDEVEDGQ